VGNGEKSVEEGRMRGCADVEFCTLGRLFVEETIAGAENCEPKRERREREGARASRSQSRAGGTGRLREVIHARDVCPTDVW
jgi:hypothetical protein